jgi:hypothetical protein
MFYSKPVNLLLLRPKIEHDESLRGYIARLARINKAESFLNAYLMYSSVEPKHASYMSIFTGQSAAKLSARCVKTDGAYYKVPYKFGNHFIRQAEVRQQLRSLCTRCLYNKSISRSYWGIRQYTVCHEHGCWMIVRCTKCNREITWMSAVTETCVCGCLFKDLKTKQATVSRQKICALIADSVSKSISDFDVGITQVKRSALQLDWLLILIDLIHKFFTLIQTQTKLNLPKLEKYQKDALIAAVLLKPEHRNRFFKLVSSKKFSNTAQKEGLNLPLTPNKLLMNYFKSFLKSDHSSDPQLKFINKLNENLIIKQKVEVSCALITGRSVHRRNSGKKRLHVEPLT